MMTQSQQKRFAEYTANKERPAAKRLAALFDDNSFTEINSAVSEGSRPSGVITGHGFIGGSPAYAFMQDSKAMGGAVCTAHSGKICRVLELAARNGVPVVGVYDSKGAFVEDGAAALNAYSDIMGRISELSGVVPTVSVITGVCAGCMAMTACSADYIVMTEKGELYPDTASDSSAKAAACKGVISDTAADEAEAFGKVRTYLSLMPLNNLSAVPEFEAEECGTCDLSTPAKAAESIADKGSLFVISPDFGKAAFTALCTVGGTAAGIAAVGAPGEVLYGDDLAKLARFVRLCDAYGLPVVTIVDCEGAKVDCGNSMRAFTRLSGAYAEAVCPKISLITGKASGNVFVAFAGKNVSADAVFTLPQAVISPMEPETAAEFLWHDRLKGASDLTARRKELAAEYAETMASAFCAAENGAVDEVISDAEARQRIISVMEISAGKRLNKRLPKRHTISC